MNNTMQRHLVNNRSIVFERNMCMRNEEILMKILLCKIMCDPRLVKWEWGGGMLRPIPITKINVN